LFWRWNHGCFYLFLYWLQICCSNIVWMDNKRKCLVYLRLGALYLTMETTTTFEQGQNPIMDPMASTSPEAQLVDLPMEKRKLISLVRNITSMLCAFPYFFLPHNHWLNFDHCSWIYEIKHIDPTLCKQEWLRHTQGCRLCIWISWDSHGYRLTSSIHIHKWIGFLCYNFRGFVL